MDWRSKYNITGETYLLLGDRYPSHFELWDGEICCKNGAFAILLGEVKPQPGDEDTALVMISDVTKEEAERLAALVAEMRSQTGKQTA